MDREVQFADVDPQVLLRVVERLGGHAVLEPSWLVQQGIPAKLVKLHTRTYRSDRSSPKTTIFEPDGKVVDELRGVYGLELLESIAREFRLEVRECLGRGTQAAEYRRAIREHLVARAANATSA